MKKTLAITSVLLLLLPVMLVMAEELGSQGLQKPKISSIGVLGKGIAISQEDPKDFEIIRVGIAKLKVFLKEKEQEKNAGVLWIGDTKYPLKNVQIGQGKLKADIYSGDQKIGFLELESVEKKGMEIWTGVMEINGKKYNLYVLEGIRKFNQNEMGEKIISECEKDPEACKEVAKQIGNRFCEKVWDKSCREKIQEFCNENPTDRRCIAIAKSYCEENMDDARCKNLVRDTCAENPSDPQCTGICERFPNLCRVREWNRIKNPSTVNTNLPAKIEAKATEITDGTIATTEKAVPRRIQTGISNR